MGEFDPDLSDITRIACANFQMFAYNYTGHVH